MKPLTRNNLTLLLLALTLFMASEVSGQDDTDAPMVHPAGISVEYGMGNYSVKDKYISNERYSGTLPSFTVGWAREHEKYVYRLQMTYRNSKDISNYNVSTDVYQFTLNQGFLYPLKKVKLFHHDLYAWLGPTTEFFFYYNKPDIAVSGFDYAQSFAGLFSVGGRTEVIYPLKRNLQLESSLGITVLSLGFRMVDSEEDNQSPANLLTLFSGLNSSFDLGARYYLFKQLSVKLAYRFELTNITAWEPLHSASDNIRMGLTYQF